MATKKTFLILVVFLVGSISLYAQISSKVDAALAQFAKEYPEYAGKAYPTINNRTWEEQMQIILDRGPSPNAYERISREFTNRFGISLPTSQSMTSEMKAWWKREIEAQAGLPNGFAHIGGFAVDVSVRNLNSQGTQLLAGILQRNGLRILFEQGNKYEKEYFVGTLLLHCY
ncbi:MAG: hypothetical protein LBQ94_02050 [Treponema sp.]|jgi:hypothetical protein|nr:hypothetical protein [Treponema sp.]